jgi:hypothetical protein
VQANRTDVAVAIDQQLRFARHDSWYANSGTGVVLFETPAAEVEAALGAISIAEAREDLRRMLQSGEITLGYFEVWDPDRAAGAAVAFRMNGLSQVVHLTDRPQRVYVPRPTGVCRPEARFNPPGCQLHIEGLTMNTSVSMRFAQATQANAADPSNVVTTEPMFTAEQQTFLSGGGDPNGSAPTAHIKILPIH